MTNFMPARAVAVANERATYDLFGYPEDYLDKFRENIAAVNRNYPASTGTTPKMKLRRIVKPGEAWIIEGTIDYGDGIPVSSVSIIETGAEGKVVRQTDYFANPFEAPAWRKKWVERKEPAGVR